MRLTTILLISLSVTACGGGGSGGSSSGGAVGAETTTPAVTGPVATATYDNDSAAVVIDGDTQPDLFWSGNVTDDAVTVDYGKQQKFSHLNVYTNNKSFSSSQPNLVIEVSADGQVWSRTADVMGQGISCSSLQLSNGAYKCEFASTETFRFARVRLTATEDIGLHQVYEIEATPVN